MKGRYFLGGLALGALIGAGIGIAIALDPVKRVKIQGAIDDAQDKVRDVEDKVRSKIQQIQDDLLATEELIEAEIAIAKESITDTDGCGCS